MTIHRSTAIFTLLVLTAVALIMGPVPAFAADKLGDVLTNAGQSVKRVPKLIAAVSYLLGLFLVIWGLFKFKDHVESPAQNPLSAAVKRVLAGGLLLALPFVGKALKGSLFLGVPSGGIDHGRRTVANMGGGGMDEMIFNLVSNAYEPSLKLLAAFCYISALLLLVTAIMRLTKTAQEGPRGPAGAGTIMTFIVAGALMYLGSSMAVSTISLFGSKTLKVKSIISSTVISGDTTRISAVIDATLAFVMIVGIIAFIRGWFVLKSFADGNNQTTIAQGLTFIIGGTLAINLGELVNVLQKSAGITNLALSFT